MQRKYRDRVYIHIAIDMQIHHKITKATVDLANELGVPLPEKERK